MSGDAMAGFLSALTAAEGGITSANMWTEVTALAGFVGTVALFAFGLYELRKVTKGASKGKVRF